MKNFKELHEALTNAIESAVNQYLADGGKLSDLDWFSYKEWNEDDRSNAEL